MIKIKKIFINIIKSVITIIVILTAVLFFYSAFFYTPNSIKNNKIEEKIKEEKIENNLQKNTISEQTKKQKVKKIKIKLRDGMFATVGNKVITRSDIINEIKIILITNNMVYSEDKKKGLQQMAATSLIKRNIKEIELEKNENIKFNNEALKNEMNKIASKMDVDLSNLEKILKNNDLDISLIENQIKTELKWNSLIYYFYNNRVSINQEELDEQLDLVGSKQEYSEYLISEIVIKRPEDSLLESEIKKIVEKVQLESFEAVAMSSSISPSAIKGGDLGWLHENSIASQFKSIILETPVGSITKGMILKDGILFFKVRDKRTKKKKTSIEELKAQLLSAEKTKILNMYARSHYENLRRSITINIFDE